MTKEQVVNILNGMDCEIAQINIKFWFNGDYRYDNVLVYLVDEPPIKSQIINSNHWCIFFDIEEFIDKIEVNTNDTVEFLNVTEFISDFDD